MKFGGRAVHSGSETLRIRGWGSDIPGRRPLDPLGTDTGYSSVDIFGTSAATPAPKRFWSGGGASPPGTPPWVPGSALGHTYSPPSREPTSPTAAALLPDNSHWHPKGASI